MDNHLEGLSCPQSQGGLGGKMEIVLCRLIFSPGSPVFLLLFYVSREVFSLISLAAGSDLFHSSDEPEGRGLPSPRQLFRERSLCSLLYSGLSSCL